MPRLPVPKAQIRTQDEKLREAILLICRRSEGDDSFGAIKLNKLLFAADFTHYLKFGKSITGQDYFRLPLGPAPRRMKPVMEAMQVTEEVAVRKTDYFGKKQNRAFALREPMIGKFSSAEIDVIDRVVARWWGVSGSAISEASHRFSGWIYAKEREAIPYPTALVGERTPTPAEVQYGLSLEQEAIRALGHG